MMHSMSNGFRVSDSGFIFNFSGLIKPTCLRSYNRRRQSLVPVRFTEKKNFAIPKIEITSFDNQPEVQIQCQTLNLG